MDIRSLTCDQLEQEFQALGQPRYRVRQVLDWLYIQRVKRWDAMTNLPRTLLTQLRDRYDLRTLELVRKQLAAMLACPSELPQDAGDIRSHQAAYRPDAVAFHQ